MAIKWAPGFTSFTTDPNAVWRDAIRDSWNNEDAGFFIQRPGDPWEGSSQPTWERISSVGASPEIRPYGYQELQSAGAWNLSDPGLQQYLNHLAYTDFGGQPTTDWRTNPFATNAVLGRLGLSTQPMIVGGAASGGIPDVQAAFGDIFSPEYLQQVEAARKYQQHELNKSSHGGLAGIVDAAGDWWSGANDFIVPAALSAIGMSYLGGAGAAGGEAAASAGGTAAGAAGAAELSTPEWLNALLAETGEAGIGAGALEGGFSGAAGLGTAATGGGMDWLTELLGETGELGIDPSVLEGGFNPAISNAPWWSSLPTGVQDLVQGVSGLGGNILDLFSGNASGGASRPGGGFLDTALATAPILAAINYARNQGPFDTSRLTSTYDQFDPNALAYEYDQNTARGRNQLTSSLAQRGVMGSSFGANDLTNFQTTRDLGRRSLINQGLAQRGNIAATLLDAEAKARGLKNDLYGRSLLALGNVFGGRNQSPVYP